MLYVNGNNPELGNSEILGGDIIQSVQLPIELQKGALDLQEAKQLECELAALIRNPERFARRILFLSRNWAGVTPLVFNTSELLESGLPAVVQTVERYSDVDSDKSKASVLEYAPFTSQAFHIDTNSTDRVIVNASDGGAFDYKEGNPDDEHTNSVSVNAGDVVLQNAYLLIHRGRNPSTNNRYVMFLYRDALHER